MENRNRSVVQEALRILKTQRKGLKKRQKVLTFSYNLARVLSSIFKCILKIYPNYSSHIRLIGSEELKKKYEAAKYEVRCLIQRIEDWEMTIKELPIQDDNVEKKVSVIMTELAKETKKLLRKLNTEGINLITTPISYG